MDRDQPDLWDHLKQSGENFAKRSLLISNTLTIVENVIITANISQLILLF